MLISFRGGKIHYSESGRGNIIVLIHGYLETMEVWETFSKKLSENFRVIRIDLPGHGESGSCGDINTMELFAEAIKAVLDSLGIRKAFLAGHSMGGYATLAFLQLFPEYLSGFSLFHSHPLPDLPETVLKRKQSIKFIKEGGKEKMIPDFVRNLYARTNTDKFKNAIDKSIEIASATSEKTIIADLNGMMVRSSGVHLLEEGSIPFLWILGIMDSHIDHEKIVHSVKLPGNSRVVILNNSGHMGFIEEEDLSVKVVTEYVKNITF